MSGIRRASVWPRLDPTRPDRWVAMGPGGRVGFVLRWGVVACGVPLALIADLIALRRGGNWDLLLTARHALTLQLVTLLVAPTAGALAGLGLVAVADARVRRERLKRAFMAPTAEVGGTRDEERGPRC